MFDFYSSNTTFLAPLLQISSSQKAFFCSFVLKQKNQKFKPVLRRMLRNSNRCIAGMFWAAFVNNFFGFGYKVFRPKRRFIGGYFPLQDRRAPMPGDTAIFSSFFVSIVQNNTAIKLSKHSNFEALINRPYESLAAASLLRCTHNARIQFYYTFALYDQQKCTTGYLRCRKF